MKGKRMHIITAGRILVLTLLAVSLPRLSVCAAASPLYSPGYAEVPLEAVVSMEPAYVVKTSPYLELTWNAKNKDYEGTYRVGVKGSIGNDQKVHVVPEDTFAMTSELGTQNGTVVQPVTCWAMKATQSDMLTLSEKTFAETTGTASVKLPGTAVYHGGITFTFSLE